MTHKSQDFIVDAWFELANAFQILPVQELQSTEDLFQETGRPIVSKDLDKDGLGSLYPDFHSWNDVVATILTYCQTKSGFNPLKKEMQPIQWTNYIQLLSTAPFLQLIDGETKTLHLYKNDINPLLDLLKDLFKSVMSENWDAVLDSVTKTVKLAVSNQGSEQCQNNFSQSTIALDKEGLVQVKLAYSTIKLVYKSGKGYEQLEQDIGTYQVTLNVNKSVCIQYSNRIKEMTQASVDDWFNGANGSSAITKDLPQPCLKLH